MILIKILFNIILTISWINCSNLEEIVAQFNEDPCIEDNFKELYSDIFLNRKAYLEEVPFQHDVIKKIPLLALNELAQHNDIEYYYYLESEEGPSHNKLFKVILKLGRELYNGEGSSIKQAKRKAAEEALLHTNYDIPELKEKNKSTMLTPTVELNNLAMKLGMKVTYLSAAEMKAEEYQYKQKNIKFSDKSFQSHNKRLNYSIYHPYEKKKLNVTNVNQQSQQFKVGVVVGNMKFVGIGFTLQSARHDAASKAVAALKQMSSNDIDQCVTDGIICNLDNIKSSISSLYEMAQKENIYLNFEIVGESGPAHEKTFITKCQFGDLTVEGVGKSKKASKRNASQNMLDKLKYVKPKDNDLKFIHVHSNLKKKTKKKKILKSGFEKLGADAKGILTAAWEYVVPADDNAKSGKEKYDGDKQDETDNFRRAVLGLSQEKGIFVQYIDLGIKQSKYYSLLFIGIKPNHVCLGDGSSYNLAHEKASLEALNFFHNLGIQNLIPSDEKFDYITNMNFGDMYILDSDSVLDEETNKKE